MENNNTQDSLKSEDFKVKFETLEKQLKEIADSKLQLEKDLKDSKGKLESVEKEKNQLNLDFEAYKKNMPKQVGNDLTKNYNKPTKTIFGVPVIK